MDIITSTWAELLQQFFPIFTAPGAEIFSHLMAGWILCTARRTVTGILPFADPWAKQAHDAYHRFFPDARWSMAKLWQLLAKILIQAFYRTGAIITLALDDTLFHRSGRKVNGAGWWRDAVRSTQKNIVYAWGLNLVVLTLQIQPFWGGEPLGLPINMRLHRKNGPTLIELAAQMIDEVRQWLPERMFRVVADGFYATLAGKAMGVTIISRIKRNANLYDLPPKRRKKRRGRPRTRGKKLAKLEKMAAHIQNWQTVTFRRRGKTAKRLVYTRVVLWYTVSRKPILLVISRDPNGKEKDDFFFTTDVTMDPAEVLACYADRWAIEDTFKNTKQLLGGQQPQTYKARGPERAAGLSLWLYSMVWLWYLKQKPRQRYFIVPPWYRQKLAPSFLDALSCLRRELWRERIKCMFGISAVHDKKFEFLLEALAPAA
jgi:integrase